MTFFFYCMKCANTYCTLRVPFYLYLYKEVYYNKIYRVMKDYSHSTFYLSIYKYFLMLVLYSDYTLYLLIF